MGRGEGGHRSSVTIPSTSADEYQVKLLPNSHSERLHLSGCYVIRISDTEIALYTSTGTLPTRSAAEEEGRGGEGRGGEGRGGEGGEGRRDWGSKRKVHQVTIPASLNYS